MFKALGEKTFYIFAACNVITIPMVWALYPETNQRSLEEMDLLFASDSIWVWEAEKGSCLVDLLDKPCFRNPPSCCLRRLTEPRLEFRGP